MLTENRVGFFTESYANIGTAFNNRKENYREMKNGKAFVFPVELTMVIKTIVYLMRQRMAHIIREQGIARISSAYKNDEIHCDNSTELLVDCITGH
jgi:hypothetical protein